MHLREIAYPVFRLGTSKPEVDDRVLYYLYTREEDEGIRYELKIVDDPKLQQPTLALRRLHLRNMGVPLSKIHHAIFFLGDLIKLATPTTWFIDSNGRLFNYTKTNRANLKFYKIAKKIPISTGGVIIEAEGINTRFKALYMPSTDMTYVGILHCGMTLVLYGFYTEKHQDTWRRV